MLITAYVLGVSEHDSSGKWLIDMESSILERRSMFTHLRVDSKTDRLPTLPKYVRSEVSFAGEATLLRVYMYQEWYNGLIDISRYGLNLKDLDHILTRSVDTRLDGKYNSSINESSVLAYLGGV